MSNIKSIINFTAVRGLTSATFTAKANINNAPDECVIRAINYTGPGTDLAGTYLIQSNLTNDFIGSFALAPDGVHPASVNTNPQTRIFLQNKTNFTDMSFTIYIVNAGGNPPTPYALLTGNLAVSIDFIHYSDRTGEKII